MKILHILNHFLPQHIAGTEMYAYHLGEALQRLGYEIVYVIPNYSKNENEYYEYNGLKVVQYAEPSVVDRALQMGKRKPDGLRHFLKVLKQENPDIVHFHELAGSNGITLHHVIAAKELGFKTVMTFHLARYTATSPDLDTPTDIFNEKTGSYNFYKSKGFSRNAIRLFYPVASILGKLKLDLSSFGRLGMAFSVPHLIVQRRTDFFKLLNNCDRAVAIARWYQKLLAESGVTENKLVFIEQGIRFGKVDIPIAGHSGTALRIIFVGRISHFKGVKMLIEVAGSFDSNEITLDIYGDSGEDELYKAQCHSLVEKVDNIQFAGRLRPEETIDVMADYDLLILPSTIHEMSPLVIREAFAARVPILASDSMGSKEQITEGKNGWFFKMNDWNDLREKLQWLSEHPEEIAKANQFPPVRVFREVAEDYEKVYRGV